MAENIKVFYGNISEHDQSFWNSWKEMLPWEERRTAADRFRAVPDKKRCIGAGILLYKVLNIYDITDFSLGQGKYGKPYLINMPDLHFNLSHSGDYVLCAVGTSPVGVDVEQYDHGNTGIAKHFFTGKEYRWVMDIPDDRDCQDLRDSRERFIRLWTMKESYCKMKGLGLNLPLSDFEILPDEGVYPEGTQMAEFVLPGHHVSVCAVQEIAPAMKRLF